MKILITGSKGMLGSELVKVFDDKNIIIAADIEQFDITNIKETLQYIKDNKPEIVIHCAAFTNVDGCEEEPETAYNINSLGTRNIAVACNEMNIPMVYISTDYVFDGTKDGSYREDDTTNSINIYGKSKLAGEDYIRTLSNKYYIVRTQWLYGHNGKNFVKTMLQLAKEKQKIEVVNDQFGCPTYTLDLANAIKQLITTPAYGTYHITNTSIVSWFQFAKDIFEIADIDNVNIIPITTEQINRVAIRPKYSPLDNFNFRLNGHCELRDYKQALKSYIKELDF